jgi:hypothetical protein
LKRKKYILKYEQDGSNFLYDHNKLLGKKINGKRGFCTKAPLQMSGNDVKSTNGWKTPLGEEKGPTSDSLGKVLHKPRRGNGLLQKINGRVCKKTTSPFPEAGGGGRYMGRTQPSNFKTFTFYIFTFKYSLYNTASFRWKEKTVLDRQQPRPTVISGSSSKQRH